MNKLTTEDKIKIINLYKKDYRTFAMMFKANLTP